MCLGFGIYHSKDEFLQKSLSVVHPFDSMCPLKDELLKVLFNIATMGPLWVVEQRKTTLSKWLIFAKDLGAQEKVLTMTLAVSENKFQDIQMISWYMHCFTGVVHAADLASPEDRLLCGRAHS